MEEYLNKGIKEIISKFPEVADILNEYNIGCAPCNVGTCLLKDIVEIHNLPSDEEQELMARITKVIYPDRDVKKSEIKRKPETKPKLTYSAPVKKLVDEHLLIKRLIALIPSLVENLDVNTDKGKRLILDCVDFVRAYADKYHHAKEEEILFKYFDEKLDIIKTMLEDHKKARNHAGSILDGLEKKDKNSVIEHLTAYKELLTEHIKKEDEILYPWIDRGLSITQVGELFSKFGEVDNKFPDAQKEYGEFIQRLEEKYKASLERRNG